VIHHAGGVSTTDDSKTSSTGQSSDMAKAVALVHKVNGEAQTLCDYMRLLKVWFDDKKAKKSKADRKLKVSLLAISPSPNMYCTGVCNSVLLNNV